MPTSLTAPFPYPGGKSRIADLVWQRFGTPSVYIEPFAGSAAVLLGRPDWRANATYEVLNDKDGFVTNFWRAVRNRPADVIDAADLPINEIEYHARFVQLRLKAADLVARLEADPEYCDPVLAGWWMYCITLSLGGTRLLYEQGAWVVRDQKLVKVGRRQLSEQEKLLSISRCIPQIDRDSGIFKKSWSRGEWRSLVHDLADRLCNVRILCGDWKRAIEAFNAVISRFLRKGETVGVFLDPPYYRQQCKEQRSKETRMYIEDNNDKLAKDVIQYAIEAGSCSYMRVAICGYADMMEMPEDWEAVRGIGYFGWQSMNRNAEERARHAEQDTVWFSPYCLKPDRALAQMASLF